jgi:hypothetical protein
VPSTPFAPKPLQVAAAVIGNALEWYDFIVFGFFAVIIARLFFPTESQYASLLLAAATYAEGRYRFRTILPAIYPGRTRHYHVNYRLRSSRCSPRICIFQMNPRTAAMLYSAVTW